MQTSLISADSGEKQVLWLKHNEGRSEETADTIFFFFFLQIPHLDNTNLDMLINGWLPLLFTLIQGEHRKYSSAQPLWIQEEEKKNGSFLGE